MLLQQLEAYAERLDLPPRLYQERPVRYIIELDDDGRLIGEGLIDLADRSSPRTRRGVPRKVPTIARTVAIKPLLLADNAAYVLGHIGPGDKPARVARCHAAFADMVARCAAATGEPSVEAVHAFLSRGPLAEIRLPDDFDAGGTIEFRVGGVFPVDAPSVRAFWATACASAGDGGPPEMQCVICGRRGPVLERLELKVKGVPGGQMSGTSIISFNAPAFESYGLDASLNAPTHAECGERFTKAVNSLLTDDATRLRLDNVVYVFWTKRASSDASFISLVREPQPEAVRVLYESVFGGGAGALALDDEPFYATALSGSGGRAVVRDWIDTTVGRARRNLARWFQLQRISSGDVDAAPLGIRQLAYATVRTGDRNNPPNPMITRALVRTALTGAPAPIGLLYQAVRRNRAEQGVRASRAALIKLVLCSQPDTPFEKEDDLVALDATSPNPAYRCGRLLALLEQVQRAALPGINATVVDRFYGSASAAPASVFARLLRGAQPHLARLERDRPGAFVSLQRRIEETLGALPAFPKTLTLEQQGLFALGYYHERARRFSGGAGSPDTGEPVSTEAEIDESHESGSEEE
jgi:CRISPR-associated protein Csd1